LLVEHIERAESGWIGETGVLATRFGSDTLARRMLDPKQDVAILPARGAMPTTGDEIIERLNQPLLPVMLFGAGHVGRAVARAVDGLPVRLAWFDSREAEGSAPGVVHLDQDQLASCVADAASDSVILIMTHDHGLDYQLATAALRSPARFVGLIGSGTKRARFLSRLAKDEVDASNLTCPIGIAGITGKDPAIIAISVVAQLMQLHGASL
jgi:xanthine dehydrogenase accessory factor